VTDLLRAGLLNDTTELEKRWHGYHLGFNHRKLEPLIRKEFDVVVKKNILFQVMYVCRRKVTNG